MLALSAAFSAFRRVIVYSGSTALDNSGCGFNPFLPGNL